jgi:hypothetical protein
MLIAPVADHRRHRAAGAFLWPSSSGDFTEPTQTSSSELPASHSFKVSRRSLVNWLLGRAKDAASTYYVRTGIFKRRSPDPAGDRHLYENWDNGLVLTVKGDKCGGDDAAETFQVHDPNAEADGNVPIPILRELANDLAARTVRAFGGPDRLRAGIRHQRIDFNQLPSDLQAAFKPYFGPAK